MDIEEGVYDQACRTERWEVIPRRCAPISVSARPDGASNTSGPGRGMAEKIPSTPNRALR